MKELWVKKTIWRRYLIADEKVEVAKKTLKNDSLGDDAVINFFDINENIEYDDEEVVVPIQYKIKEI